MLYQEYLTKVILRWDFSKGVLYQDDCYTREALYQELTVLINVNT